jgi:hypothetical protein
VNTSTGAGTVVWQRWNGSANLIESMQIAADGTFGPVQTLSASGENSYAPQIVIDPTTGTSTVAWQFAGGTYPVIQAAQITADGAIGATQTLSSPLDQANAPAAAIDTANGTVVLVWSYGTSASVVQASQSQTSPTNSAVPTITGTAVVGQTLTTSTGTWSAWPSSSYAYAWQRCNAAGASCSTIAGAVYSTYVLQSADVKDTVEVVVTAANVAGNASATSTASGIVAPTVPPKTLLHLTFRVSPTHFRSTKYKKVKLTYSLDDAATVQLSLQRKLVAYQVKGKCLVAKPHHARKTVKRCTLYSKAKGFNLRGATGKHSEALAKVIKSRYFREKGTYRLTAVAVAPSSAYANSAPRTVVLRSQ